MHSIIRKPNKIKNPQSDRHRYVHPSKMMCTSEIDLAISDEPADIDTFINNAHGLLQNIP